MTDTADTAAPRRIWRVDLAVLLRVCIAVAMALSLHLVLTQEINWDEFFYLSQVHSYLRGDLNLPLQTIHVHFWNWLALTGQDEIGQIRIARVILWLVQCGTIWALYRLAREFFDDIPALFTLLVYLSFDYVLVNGTSFRTDTTAVFFLMVSLVVLLGPLSIWRMGLFCLLVALAGLVTVKVIFYAPAYIGLALWRVMNAGHRWRMVVRLAIMVVGTFAVFAALYFAHKASLPGGDNAAAGRMLSGAARITLMETGLFPRLDYMYLTALYAPVSVVLVAAGALVVLFGGRGLSGGWRAVPVLILLALPLGSFVFYRNAFPYYYAFILPPAMLLAGAVMAGFDRHRAVQSGLAVLVTITIVFSWRALPEQGLTHQARTIEAVHRMFPEPVAYFDRSKTIASFPQAGFFMTSWGMSGYVEGGRAVLHEAMKEQAVPLLLLNSPHLVAAVAPDARQPRQSLLDADRKALAENYIPHWGVIWVAGKSLSLTGEDQTIEILVPGPYTVEGDAPVVVDGREYAPGDVVTLTRGPHRAGGLGEVVLRWGDHLFQPEAPAPAPPFFKGFRPSPNAMSQDRGKAKFP